jgi:hypothetical protein
MNWPHWSEYKRCWQETIAFFPLITYWIFYTTRTANKTARPAAVLLLRVYSLPRGPVYRAACLATAVFSGSTITHRQKCGLINLHLFFQNKGSEWEWGRRSVQCDRSWSFYYYSIFESFTCFGLIGPSSEGAWETTNVPRSTGHNKPNSPCYAIVHVGIGYIN